MIRRIAALWLSLAMVLGFIVIVDVTIDFIPRVKGTTLYVNMTGDGGAYTKIQYAIDNASEGYTVFVYNGTYYENVVVNKTINLTGLNRINTTIDGGGSGNVVMITVDWVNVSGFTITGSGSGTGNAGVYLSHVKNCIITSNNISSNNLFGIHLDSSSSHNDLKNNNILLNKASGIRFFRSSNNNITNNNISNNNDGIYIYSSSNYNIITNNNVSSNNMNGIYLYSSPSYNIIENNNVFLNSWFGIWFDFSINNNIVADNNVFSNNWAGINLESSSHNLIRNNNFSNNWYGIYTDSSSNNLITTNNVSSNDYYGISLYLSSNTRVYHNNIVDNVNQAYDNMENNYWNDSYPSGGNYWSNYGGVDDYKGPYQDIPGSDGIGDTNYSIDSDSLDYYPLMENYTFKPYKNYTILKQGWNLISIPLIQVDTNIDKVLEMIEGYYNTVEWYNISDIGDPWKIYNVNKPFGNDLFELNKTMGFWIYINQPGDTIYLYNGTQPTENQTITLHPGWNLVGYPSQTSYNRTKGLNNLTFGTHVGSIWTFDAANQKWEQLGESDYFEPGRGYWINAKVECTWEVPL